MDRSQIEAVVERACAEMEKDNNGKVQRCDLRKKLEAQKGEFAELFGDMQAEGSPADQVMQQLENQGNGTIRPQDVSQAILESARLNQKQIDPRVLKEMTQNILSKSPNLTRKEIRAALEETKQL